MKKRSSLALILIFSFSITITAQNQNPSPAQQNNPKQEQKNGEDVVRITTNLVQVDTVVTDKSGKLVTDLKPEEFEIYEDNHEQKITNFSFVSSKLLVKVLCVQTQDPISADTTTSQQTNSNHISCSR